MSIELLNMDCMDFMATLPDKSFDLAIVDVPYGIGVKTNIGRRAGVMNANPVAVWDSSPPPDEYFIELLRVSKNQIIWGANHFADSLPTASSPCWIVWDKLFSEDVSFASCELAYTSFASVTKRIKLSSARKNGIHPCEKPISLYEWILTNYAKPGQRILDTHLGSGSSAIAAHNLGFDFVGMELDADYHAAAVKRFEQHKAQGSLFVPNTVRDAYEQTDLLEC